MKKVIIRRGKSTDQGTIGLLDVFGEDGTLLYSCISGELPWRDDKNDISCTNAQRYRLLWLWSNHHKCNLYHLVGDERRSQEEIHAGNWCGDVSKGYKSDVQGCVLVGKASGKLDGQWAVLESVHALQMLHDVLGGQEAELEIIWTPGAEPAAC